MLPWPAFLQRAVTHVIVGTVGIVVAVGIGTIGYHITAGLPWVDAFLNASMILAGMGPVDRLETTVAKIFAALYALFSGLVFIALMGIVLAPWAHRVMHVLHIAESESDGDSTSPPARGAK
jgi:hypothetical protein